MFPLQDPILVFTVLMLIILLAPLLAERLKVPDLVLLLGIGALLGPNVAGVLERDNAITLFGSVGLLYIMFLAGLEIDLHRFIRTRRRSITFGLLTFSIPQLLGTLAGRYILGFDWMASVLLASLFASHTLLAYPVASRFGLARSEPVAITVGGTIITDTLALLVLAVVADMHRGMNSGTGFWLNIGFGIIGLIMVICFGVPLLTRWFFKKVSEHGGTQFIFVLTIVCACSYLSHYAKMEPIIGAFLAGAAFNRLIPERSPLMNRVEFVGNNLFIPFFLISVGMLVDFKSLSGSAYGWLVLSVMVSGVVISKYLAAWITGSLFKYSADAMKIIFGLSVVQAAATLAAVLVGYELKIFDATVLNGAIAMILVTCLLGAWCVDHFGRKLAEQESVRREAPCAEQRMLVALKKPESSLGLLNLSFMLRKPSVPGMIYPLTVVNDIGDTDAAVAKGEKHLAHCLSQAASVDIPVSPKVRVDINPSDGLVHVAKEFRASILIIGWEKRVTLGTMLFGTMMESLIADCPSRLLFCRLLQPPNTFKRIIIPFGPLSSRRHDLSSLLDDLKSLSRQLGADIKAFVIRGEDELTAALEGLAAACPISVDVAGAWRKIQDAILQGLNEDDLLLLPCERRDSPLWHPGIENLQQLVVNRSIKQSFLMAYPSLQSGENAESAGISSVDNTTSATNRSLSYYGINIPSDMRLEDALEVMVKRVLEDSWLQKTILQQILASARSYPLSLGEGAALLHCHCDGISNPMLLVGTGGKGDKWQFNNLKGRYHTIMMLLSPKGDPQEIHLNTLADLARRFLDKDFITQLETANSSEAICELMKRK